MLKTWWVIEKYGNHTALGYATTPGDFEWVGFNDDRLILFGSQEDAELFMRTQRIENAFTVEHGWLGGL